MEITVENAPWIRRLVEGRQEVRVQLQMDAQTLADAEGNRRRIAFAAGPLLRPAAKSRMVT